MEDHRPILPLAWLPELPVIEHWFEEAESKAVPFNKQTMSMIGDVSEPYQNVLETILKEFCVGKEPLMIRTFASPALSKQKTKTDSDVYVIKINVEASYSLPTVKGDLRAKAKVFETVADVLAYLFPNQPINGEYQSTQLPAHVDDIPEEELVFWRSRGDDHTLTPVDGQENALIFFANVFVKASNDIFFVEEKVEETKSVLDRLHLRLSSQASGTP